VWPVERESESGSEDWHFEIFRSNGDAWLLVYKLVVRADGITPQWTMS